MSNFEEKSKYYKDLIEKSLPKYITEPDFADRAVYEAMLYALTNGGKRIRPILTLEFCRLCCGDESVAIPFACAIEMIHCASLVHDDLPCMDDDDLRRGKPSCHVAYGEAQALLAGDGLLLLSLETILSSVDNKRITDRIAASAALELAKASGYLGMIGGQTIDIASTGRNIDLETLKKMHSLKTGALIKCACILGCLAGGADDKAKSAAIKYAQNIGLAFQIVDDVLDVIGNEQDLGKSLGKDAAQDKTTFISYYSVEESLEYAKRLTEYAKNALAYFGNEAEFLIELANSLSVRRK